jgi:NADPH2:quinone reductase
LILGGGPQTGDEQTMHAWTVEAYGPYREALRWSEAAAPKPGEGQALVRVGAAGVAFALMLRIAGAYQVRDPLPFVPGTDLAGTVVAAGRGSPWPVGARVMASLARGAFAELALVEGPNVYAVPDGMPDTEAAAMLNPFQTAYIGLVHQAGLHPGEVLLVHGAAGGVGLAAVQIGAALGARVIATVGSAEKAEACRQNGAEAAIDYRQEDFVTVVNGLTDGRGADVIFDPVGGDVFDASRRCIAFRGRLVVVGFTSGRIPELKINRVLLRNFSVTGYTVHGYRENQPALVAQAQDDLVRLYGEGRIRPVVSRVLPLSALKEALALVEERQVIGKVVVVPE